MEKPLSEMTADERRKLNELARHQLIRRLYLDILIDMQVCKLEGWDQMSFIRQLQDLLNGFSKEKHYG